MTTTEQPTSDKSAGPDAAAMAVAVLDALDRMLPACDRPDLMTRATAARRRLERSTCTVLVVGEFKKGKSSLINALVNAPVCPVDDDVATAKPIEVRNSAEPSAEVVYRPVDGSADDEGVVTDIPFEDIAKYTSEPLAIGLDPARISCVRVGLPRQLLAGGLVLVDTPGVGGLPSAHFPRPTRSSSSPTPPRS
jgi:ribosome biogenesis GTPase A